MTHGKYYSALAYTCLHLWLHVQRKKANETKMEMSKSFLDKLSPQQPNVSQSVTLKAPVSVRNAIFAACL